MYTKLVLRRKMVEPYLLPATVTSTSAQTPQPWQNEFLFSTTERNQNHKNHQLFDVDDDVQFISEEVRPGPSRLAQTVDLKKSIFDIVNDELDVYLNENGHDTHSTNNKTVHSLPNRHTTHTITTGQLELDNNVALPNPIPQSLPQITVANFAKENRDLSNNVNGTNDTKNILDGLHEATDWLKEANVVNHVFDNGVTEQPPKATEDDWKWEDIFGMPVDQLIPATNDHQPSTNISHFHLPLPIAGASNTSALTENPPIPKPFLPQTNHIDQQNQPGPSGLAHQQTNNMEQAFVQQTFKPYGVNGTVPDENQLVASFFQNMKRKHTGTIPIKVVRSTQQYATLIEMGFVKKDIETALRKFNLDLHETIEYLSEPKRPAKRRKKDQDIAYQQQQLSQEHAELLNAIQQSIEQTQPNIQPSEQPNKVDAEPIKKPANLYEELLQLEETGGIVKSVESFDCDICMETIEMKDGMILRNCLHRYCKDCLNGTIVHSDEVTIKCPYVSCEEMVQDREIRAVLSQDEYEKFLMKSVRVAQVTISGTILCNLPDCNGWCICEDVVNEFKCPQCKNINCIPCKAIHPERNCREYQDDLAAGDANGIISGQRRSEQAIQDLINRNEAMKCFKCGILIMKRDGCDYIQCVMCKSGICWATRGPRYGPGGVGDLSGGCQCSVQKKCHKDCRGCH